MKLRSLRGLGSFSGTILPFSEIAVLVAERSYLGAAWRGPVHSLAQIVKVLFPGSPD